MLTRRDTFLKVFKAVIQMNKVKRLDTNQFHNIKTLKNLVKMKMMVFQVTPNSKIKCKKRSNKIIISSVNHFGVNIIKTKLLQSKSKLKINTSVITRTTPAQVTKVPTKRLLLLINQLQLHNLITLLLQPSSNTQIKVSIKQIKMINKIQPKFLKLRMNHR